MSRSFKIYLFSVLGLIGIATAMYAALPHGPGLSPDSTVYLESADNFIRGNGFFSRSRPLTRFPFFYPFLLSTAEIFGMDVFAFSRVLHSLLMGANTILLGVLVFRMTGGALIPAVLSGGLFLSSGPVFAIHAMAWSEPPFLFLMLLGLIALRPYLRSGARGYFVAASLLFSLAALTRYAGVVLVGGLIVAAWMPVGMSRNRRVVDAGLALGTWLIPFGLWILRNLVHSGETVDRKLSLLPVGFSDLRQFFSNLLGFILPETLPVWFRMIILLILAGCVIYLYWVLAQRSGFAPGRVIRSTPMLHVILVVAVGYVALLAFSVSFLSANIPLDHRILVPLFVLVLIAIPGMTQARHRDRKIFVWAAGLLILTNMWTTPKTVSKIARNGAGYSSVGWQNSELIDSARRLEPSTELYSNRAGAVWFWTRRTTLAMPQMTDTQSGTLNRRFDSEMDRIGSEIKEGRAAVLYFTNERPRWHEADSTQIMSFFDGVEQRRYEDGILFIAGQNEAGAR